MGAPIRSPEEIALIVNKGQHAIADLGYSLMDRAKIGEDTATSEEYQNEMFRLIIIRILLQNILDTDGNVKAYYQASDNEKKFNKILTGIARLAGFYGGPSAIPLLTGKRIPLYFFPSTASPSTIVIPSTGQIITFENLDVDAPGEVVDSFPATSVNRVLYIVDITGSNLGEGSRSFFIIVNIRSSSVRMFVFPTDENGGTIPDGVEFTGAISGGNFELSIAVPTDNWIVRGSRIT